MNIFNSTFLLRLAVAIILLVHSVGGIFDNGIHDFGEYYLKPEGFGSLGVPLAWAIKLSHIVCAVCLLFEKFVKWACLLTIAILVAGIIMVHFKEGWFVVGGGRNGIEFNFLLIFVLLTIMFPEGISRKAAKMKSTNPVT